MMEDEEQCCDAQEEDRSNAIRSNTIRILPHAVQ